MRKIKPIEIGEFTPMTVPEMKNVFGGSGDFIGSGNKKCSYEGSVCSAIATYQTSKDVPSESKTLYGTCQTVSGTMSGSGTTGVVKTSCECVIAGEPPSGTTKIVAGITCAEEEVRN